MHQLLPHVAKKITDIPKNVIDLYKEIAERPPGEGMSPAVQSALGWAAIQGAGKLLVHEIPKLSPWVMAFNIVNAVRSPWAKDLWDAARRGHGNEEAEVREILDAGGPPVSQVLINEAAAAAEAERRAALPSAPTPQGDPDYDENGGDDNGGPSPGGPPVSQVLINEAEAAAAEAAAAKAATTADDVEENDDDDPGDEGLGLNGEEGEPLPEPDEIEQLAIDDPDDPYTWEADGGLVERLDKELPRPTEPDVADDLQRMLSEGEFVIPVNVVKHFGEKFFSDLISAVPLPEKNREIGLKKRERLN